MLLLLSVNSAFDGTPQERVLITSTQFWSDLLIILSVSIYSVTTWCATVYGTMLLVSGIMAETNNEQVLQNEDNQMANNENGNNVNELHESDDNESVSSNKGDNTNDFSRLEFDIKEQMSNIAAQVKKDHFWFE